LKTAKDSETDPCSIYYPVLIFIEDISVAHFSVGNESKSSLTGYC
jgi:hypothetical protein